MIFTNFLPFNYNFDIFLSIKSKVFRNTEFKYLKKKHSFFIFKNPINFQGYITKNFKDFNGQYKHLINIGLKSDLQVYSDLKFYSIIENSKFTFSKMLKKNVKLLKNNYNVLNSNKNSERLSLFFFRVFKLSFHTSILNELGNYIKIQKIRLNLFNLTFFVSDINLKNKQTLFSLIVLSQAKKNKVYFSENNNIFFLKFYFNCFNFSFINTRNLFYKFKYIHFKNNLVKYLYSNNFNITFNKGIFFLFYNKIIYSNFFVFCLFDLYSNIRQYQYQFNLIIKNKIINKSLKKKKIFFFKKIFTFRLLKKFKKIILNINDKDILKGKIDLKSILLAKNRRIARKKIKFLTFFLLKSRSKLSKYKTIKSYFRNFDYKNYKNVKRKFKLNFFFRLTYKKILKKLVRKNSLRKKVRKKKKLRQKFFKHFALVFFYYHHFFLKEFRLKIFPKKFKYFYANEYQQKYRPKFRYKAFDLKTRVKINRRIRKKIKLKKKKNLYNKSFKSFKNYIESYNSI